MAGYRISPQDVNATLGRVHDRAGALGQALESVWTHLPASSGGSTLVADALGGYAEAAHDEMRTVSDRLEAVPGAIAKAVAAFIEGDEEMAEEHRQAMSQAEAGRTVPLGPPSGIHGPPVPSQGGEQSVFDPSRFGGTGTSAPFQPDPVFDPTRFGGRTEAGS